MPSPRTPPGHAARRSAARAQAVAQVRQRLLQQSFPRLQMALIVALTGGFGLLASFGLLQAGLGQMALRYPLALGLAYLFFLLLIWLWLRTTADDWLDLGNLPDVLPGRGPGICQADAGAAFDGPGAALDQAGTSPLRAVGDAAAGGPDLDDLAIPLAAVALALGMALALLYLVYIAPLLLAEVLVDGALAYALLRHLRGQDPQHWLASTWRHTWLPFLASAVLLSAVGAALAWHMPGARSIGQALGSRAISTATP
jgi:hypothetical protein